MSRPISPPRRRFANAGPMQARGVGALIKWLATRQRPRWPALVANPPLQRPSAPVAANALRATLIGHSTVLLEVAGLNILTDPVWSNRVGPLPFLGVKRSRPPAAPIEALPAIDAILLSHNHYDHLDRPTLAALARRDNPRVIAGLKVAGAVPSRNVVELDWWESVPLSETGQATFVPAQHFSARTPFDRNATLWGGFVIETPAGPIYFAGDTGFGPHFSAIRRRFGPMTLSLLPIGAYAPRWFMAPVHIDPAEALAASRILESKISVAIHYETFRLADDGFEEPAKALAEALAGVSPNLPGADFRLLEFGASLAIGPCEPQ